MVREFKRLGLGRVLVTAYTGVAAAPFGGPTLLKLLNLNVRTRTNKQVAGNDATDRQIRCKKFNDECGAPIEEFGCVIIDEVSFTDAIILGHVDQGFASLLGNNELCGGMPLLLCGDNHQKPPPGGTYGAPGVNACSHHESAVSNSAVRDSVVRERAVSDCAIGDPH